MLLNHMPDALGTDLPCSIDTDKWAEQQYDLAYEYYFQGDWQAAENCVVSALRANPLDSRFRLLLAQVYCARGWLDMSLSELKLLQSQDPNNPGGRSLAALLKTKMTQQQLSIARKPVASGPWKSVVKRALWWLN